MVPWTPSPQATLLKMVICWSPIKEYSLLASLAGVIQAVVMSGFGTISYRGKPSYGLQTERPLNDTTGALSFESHGNLVLHDGSGSLPVWSTNVSSTTSNDSASAQLLDSGNLVLIRGLTRSVVWQSFDHPTDTYLPWMKLGLDRRTGLDKFITSWKSDDDPAPGGFTYRINSTGYPQLIMYKDKAPYWRAGPWTGTRWSGVPTMVSSFILNDTFVNSATEISISYSVTNESILTRLVVNETGFLKRLTWHDQDQRWNERWSSPNGPCDYYSHCGPNSECDPYSVNQFECKCLPGFVPKSPSDWKLREGSGGCIRTQGASTCKSGEGFVKLTDVKVPDTSTAEVDMSLILKECEQKCLRDCNCTAYATANETGLTHGCLTWHGDLVDTRTFMKVGQDLYVRVDAFELAKLRRKESPVTRKEMLAIILVSAAGLLVLGGLLTYQLRLKRGRGGMRWSRQRGVATSLTCFGLSQGMKDMDGENRTNSDLPFFDFSTIAAATDKFSLANKLGRGGFGSVYKGVMDDGKEIAVKRLSKNSGQGIEEFKNEIKVIAKLQHRNLVKLLGFCIQEDEKLLIYEYLPNKSLDSLLFDESKRKLLDWKRRFEIAFRIAHGLMYMHQESRLRIIHRDLKASNILLDDALNPKISDFGMARMCREDQTEGTTERVVGTYGYMAPEYVMEGLFSVKSDVYSFGVLLLEIIAGERVNEYHHVNPSSTLIGHAWELWNEGKCMEILDKLMGGSYSDEMVSRCIQIALLCVQEFAEDRPTMCRVVFMLGSMDVPLPSPKPPPLAFIYKSDCCVAHQASRNGTSSINDVTVTLPEAR